MDSYEKNKTDIKDDQQPDEGIKNQEDENVIPEEKNELNKKDIEISKLEKEVAELKDRFLRKAAEFENYKRRSENDQINLIKYAAESFIIKLLPIVDDMERSLQHIDSAKDVDSLKEGLKLVYDKLLKVLDDQGVKKLDSVGKPFDVAYHEALMQRKDNSVEPHTVLDELEKGYMYKDKVIRHAKVVVSEESTEVPIESNPDKTNNKETSKK